ncbi:hypothetical protein BKA66DRAFT_426565 [Pyrenochaeta sp. MPI-SDFR-AT-0127]|nr:hypothetical protein BKA66DRAFT_426565 [Pyrenochaeta sp. MPI-SDFR-AT-0127]
MRKAAAWRCGSPDPDLRHDKRQTGGHAFVFPSTKGEEPSGSLGCVGTGANKDLGEPIEHGRGLAQRAQWQRQSQKFKTTHTLFGPSSPFTKANTNY